MKKLLTSVLFFYFLTLFQTSFFPHFPMGCFLNFVLLTIILINLFEDSRENFGLFSAFFSGFFLDIFSKNFLGFWILILLATSFFLKYIFKKYVRFPFFHPVRNLG